MADRKISGSNAYFTSGSAAALSTTLAVASSSTSGVTSTTTTSTTSSSSLSSLRADLVNVSVREGKHDSPTASVSQRQPQVPKRKATELEGAGDDDHDSPGKQAKAAPDPLTRRCVELLQLNSVAALAQAPLDADLLAGPQRRERAFDAIICALVQHHLATRPVDPEHLPDRPVYRERLAALVERLGHAITGDAPVALDRFLADLMSRVFMAETFVGREVSDDLLEENLIPHLAFAAAQAGGGPAMSAPRFTALMEAAIRCRGQAPAKDSRYDSELFDGPCFRLMVRAFRDALGAGGTERLLDHLVNLPEDFCAGTLMHLAGGLFQDVRLTEAQVTALLLRVARTSSAPVRNQGVIALALAAVTCPTKSKDERFGGYGAINFLEDVQVPMPKLWGDLFLRFRALPAGEASVLVRGLLKVRELEMEDSPKQVQASVALASREAIRGLAGRCTLECLVELAAAYERCLGTQVTDPAAIQTLADRLMPPLLEATTTSSSSSSSSSVPSAEPPVAKAQAQAQADHAARRSAIVAGLQLDTNPLGAVAVPGLSHGDVLALVSEVYQNTGLLTAQAFAVQLRQICEALDAPVALRVGLLVTLFEQAPRLTREALVGHMKQAREFIISQLGLAAPLASGIPTVIRAGGLVPRRPDPHAAESKASHRRAVPVPVPVARVGALSVAAAARAIADLYRSLIDGGRLRNAGRPDAAAAHLVNTFLGVEADYLNQRHVPNAIRVAVNEVMPQVEAALKNEVTLAQLPPSR